MSKCYWSKLINILVALVWLVNGLFCKVFNLVPRHKEIVSRILHLEDNSAKNFTLLIGICEVLMAVWILSRLFHKLNAIVQILVIISMNLLEFILAPDLLLWGKLNAVFALLFIMLIYYNEFILEKERSNV